MIWLKDLLPEKMLTARVMTFGYNAKPLGAPLRMTFSHTVAFWHLLLSRRILTRRPCLPFSHTVAFWHLLLSCRIHRCRSCPLSHTVAFRHLLPPGERRLWPVDGHRSDSLKILLQYPTSHADQVVCQSLKAAAVQGH